MESTIAKDSLTESDQLLRQLKGQVTAQSFCTHDFAFLRTENKIIDATRCDDVKWSTKDTFFCRHCLMYRDVLR